MNFKLITILFVLSLSACSIKGDTTANSSVDTVAVTQVDVDYEGEGDREDEGGGAFDSNVSMYPEIQTRLDDFLKEFESVKDKTDKVMFELHTDYEGAQYTFHFVKNDLVFLHFNIEGEGGYQESIIIKPSLDSEVMLNSNSEGSSYFTFPLDGLPKFFKVQPVNDGNPIVREVIDFKSYDYWAIVVEHLKTIEAHKNEFSGDGSWREFFLEKKTVKSDYGGTVEIIKRYQVDNSLMNLNLLELVNRPGINYDALQGFLSRYEALHDNGTEYEIHSQCGHVPFLKVYEEDDQYYWVMQGLQDAWEAKIIGFEEGEGDEYIISLLASGAVTKRIIVKDPQDSQLVFIDSRPYTTNAKKYKVVDDKSECQ